ncbi:MAG: RDD family protein [Pseudomonadota bacterium]
MKWRAQRNARARQTSDESERSRALVTPEGLALPVKVAAKGARLGALMIDMIILLVGLYVVALLLDQLSGGTVTALDEETGGAVSAAREFLYIVSVIFGFFAWYGYFLVQELSPRGATLGKRILGVRVAARGGGRLTPEAIIARNLLRDIEIFYPIVFVLVSLILSVAGEMDSGFVWAALAWFLIFALFPFFNKDALRAGDIVAGTWVLEAPKAKLAAAMSAQGSATKEGSSDITGARYEFGEVELSVYGEKELQTLERLLREGNADALEAVHATICRKIGWEPGAGDERAFLEAFYAQLRARLENDMRFGKRKADKHS